ncbi:hypothetical protein LINPERPRIM_LOCUS34327, partial [Linum perenne]
PERKHQHFRIFSVHRTRSELLSTSSTKSSLIAFWIRSNFQTNKKQSNRFHSLFASPGLSGSLGAQNLRFSKLLPSIFIWLPDLIVWSQKTINSSLNY